MSVAQLPRAFWGYLGLTAALFVFAVIDSSRIVFGGVVLTAVLTVQMARRRRWAWAILVLLNTWPLLGVLLIIPGSTVSSVNGRVVSVHHIVSIRAIVLVLLLAGLEWCLLARSMRAHIASRYPPRAQRPRVRPRLRRT